MNQLATQMQSAMAQMEAAMKNMPPEQRAAMEKMMKGKMPSAQPAAPAPITYTAKGSATANGFSCTKYDGERGGSKVAEVCAAPAPVLKLSASDVQVFDKMREFMSGFQSALGNLTIASSYSGFIERGFEGFPVQQTQFSNGQAVERTDLKSAEQATFSDADFSLGNAKKADLPQGRR